jgi:hypothetical protein
MLTDEEWRADQLYFNKAVIVCLMIIAACSIVSTGSLVGLLLHLIK